MRLSHHRRILILLIFTLVLAGTVAAQGPQLAPEPIEGEVYYAPFPVNITLDGDFSDWNGVPRVQMGQGVGRPAVTFAAAATNDTLYLWGDVIDDNIISGEHGEDYWNEDSLEFYFNGTGNFDLTSYIEGVAQLTLPPINIGATPEDLVYAGVQHATLNAEAITIATDRGWAVEVAIPLQSDIWSIQPEQDLEMGFQVHLNGASESNRDTKLVWSIYDTSDTSHQNPSVFGKLSFYEVASAPESTGDYFFRSEISENGLIDDFENGIWMNTAGPDNKIGLVPNGSAVLSIQQVPQETEQALPEQRAVANNILAIDYDETGGSYIHAFTDGLNSISQDWSAYNSIGLWIYSDAVNTSANVSLYGAEQETFHYTINNLQDEWQYVIVPFGLFESSEDAIFDESNVFGYGVNVSTSDESGTIYLDNVRLYTLENTESEQIRGTMPQQGFIVDESINWESREWSLVWSDEFEDGDGALISDANWTCETGGEGWGNNELEYYTTNLENVAQTEDGYLAITAMRGQPENNEPCWYGQCAFTSARCITKDKVEFTYGRVEARLQIPRGQGIWPAFWMLGANFTEVGWPNSGEIDIMENVGFEPERVHGTIHGPSYSGASGIGNGYSMSDEAAFADDFHVYAIEWDPNVIRWYVDGNLFSTISVNDVGNYEWVYDHDFFIILNVAVGGAWPGNPDETTEMPQQMLIDYVRVYEVAD